jgi:hypothetical protein
LQGIRNFCDYLAAKAVAAGLFSTTGALGASGVGALIVGVFATTTGVGVPTGDTIIYFLLD